MDKIKLNYDQDDIEGAVQEYEILSEYFTQLSQLLSGYDDNQINSLKMRVIGDFNNIGGQFSDKLRLLTKQYSEKYNHDDEFTMYIQVVLTYLFEQCLVGRKTPAE